MPFALRGGGLLDAELVIEGEVRPTDKRDEGPFGEYTGHYGGPRLARPTIHVTAITHRRDPILHLAYQGAPPHETDVLTAVGKEAELLRHISLPGVKAVHLTEGGGGVLHVVIAVEKLYEGYGKMAGMAVLSVPAGRSIKQVTVVDATRYNAASFPPVCQPAAEALDRVGRDWARYEIALAPARGGPR